MPNYEYKCTQCDHLFEIWQAVGSAAPPCANCGGAVKKVFHPPRVIFKGSGFYVTDLRAENASKSGSAKNSEGAGTESTQAKSESTNGSAKTETADQKPAAATDTKAAPGPPATSGAATPSASPAAPPAASKK